MKLDVVALLMAAGFGVVGGFVAAPYRLAWSFGLGIAVLVYVTIVAVGALEPYRRPVPPVSVPRGNGQLESSGELWRRARRAGAQVPLAGSLMDVLNNHMLTIIDAEGSKVDHRDMITELRKDMESATKLLERAANEPKLDHKWLAEELQRMCDNLERNEKDARTVLDG